MKRSVLSLLIILMLGYSSAQQIDSATAAQLQLVLDINVANTQLKGISAALITKEGDIWTGVSGISHGTVLITDETLFGMGSVTKTYVASIIMQLYQEGSLDLVDPLHYYLPPFDHIDSNITIAQLLNHTSGIYDWMSNPNSIPSWFANGTKWWTPEEVLNSFVNAPYFSPGQGFHYSNTGYLLLGMIIEEVTGNSYAYELQQRLLSPLDLDTTFFWPWMSFPYNPAHPWYILQGILTDISGMADTSAFTSAFTAGANISTPLELAQWIKALMEGNVVEDSCLALMMAPNAYPYYGMGLNSHYHNYYTSNWCYGHTGDLAHKTAAFYVPADSLTLVVMHNTQPINATSIWDELYNALTLALTSPDQTEPELLIFPNPTTGTVTIKLPANCGARSVEVFTADGRLVSRMKDFESGYQTDLTAFPRGIYILRVTTERNTITKKILKL